MSTGAADDGRGLRWAVYVVLMAVAVGQMTGRILAVNSVNVAALEDHRVKQRLDQEREKLAGEGLADEEIAARLAEREEEFREKLRMQRPFLSANDRSRWLAVRAIVERQTFAIDEFLGEPTWDTIDMVQHVGRDGQLHLYSSKPPLFTLLLAAEYWTVHKLTGMSLGTHPYEVGRPLVFINNVLPMLALFLVVAAMAERLGTTDWGRIFVVAAATLGTQLNTFAVVINNHIPAAVTAAVTLYAWLRIRVDGDLRGRWFLVAGLFAALTAANELPALAFLCAIGLALIWRHPRQTLVWFAPAALLVVTAYFATNYVAHASLRPPYMHRSETDPADNWYDYSYEVNGRVRESYWRDPQGIDRGEPSRGDYALHVLVGHHGVFSLTPLWLLSVAGMWFWLRRGTPAERELALLVLGLTVVCLAFYILRPQDDRNYGGMTSGLRWMFWFAPLWLATMLPAADRASRSKAGIAFAGVALAWSTMSASYPNWNPWVHPWLYNWLGYWNALPGS
ncbi:MAG: hypothetical protein WD851_03020 [Pirellulales bacterium]